MKGSDMPCKQILPSFLIDDLRCGAPMPTLRRRPCFDFYEELCHVSLKQIFCKATDEGTMLPPGIDGHAVGPEPSRSPGLAKL